MIDSCTDITYPQSWGFKREPARPAHLRIDYCGSMKFDDNFDWDHLWYDAVQVHDNAVLLIGAPLYATKDWMMQNATFEGQDGRQLPCQFAELDRVCYTIITVPGQTGWIDMVTKTERTRIGIHTNDRAFDGKHAMVTLQKDNPIEWIQQWITYHNAVLGVNGFVIYDNGSTRYKLSELEAALQYPGITVRIVGWPYPYGPQGSDHAPWDSDYGQYAMLEHAKFRYLSGAALVMNNDIDELIVTKGIQLSDIVGFLRSNQSQCLRYKGVWIEPYDLDRGISAADVPFKSRHIRNYYCTDPSNKRGIGYKWMLVPSATTMNQQWLVHQINGQMVESDQLYYAHYLALNTNWSWSRDKFNGKESDLIPDQLLMEKLKKMGG